MKRIMLGFVWFILLYFGMLGAGGAIVGSVAGRAQQNFDQGYQAGYTAGEVFGKKYGTEPCLEQNARRSDQPTAVSPTG